MDCMQTLAKMITEKMDALGWLVPKPGTDQPSSFSAKSFLPTSKPKASKPPETCTAGYLAGFVTLQLPDGERGTTYEAQLWVQGHKKPVASQIALYLGQPYRMLYHMLPSEVLYVTLVARKKGYSDSDLLIIPVTTS